MAAPLGDGGRPRQRRAAGLPRDPGQRAVYERLRPEHVTDVAEFGLGLSQLKLWLGDPPLKRIHSLSHREGHGIGKSTISGVYQGRKLPTEDALTGFLVGLGLGPYEPEHHQWLDARRRLAAQALEHSRRRMRPRVPDPLRRPRLRQRQHRTQSFRASEQQS
ncbi:hypothetical protein ACFQ2B_01520 [Streptomyces stramineus]